MATGDQYFDKVVLGCHFNGDRKLVGQTDSVLHINGSASESTAQSKFGGSSAYFDGSVTSYMSVSADGLSLGTGDFTIEMFVRFASPSTYQYLLASDSMTNGYFQLAINGMAANAIGIGRSNVDWPLVWSGHNLVANTWYHLAISRSGGVARCFIDGVKLGSDINGSHDFVFGPNVLHIGHQVANGTMNGYIDDLRITKGVGRYVANFTPPSSAFPDYYAQLQGTVRDSNGSFCQRLVRAHRRDTGALVAEGLSHPSTGEFTLNTLDASKHYAVVHDSDAWITYLPFNGDNDSTLFYEWGGKAVTAYGNAKLSTAQSKFGGASAYFDGAGDYVTLPVSSDLAFGTWDFTIEAWVRLDSTGIERAIFDNRAATSDTGLYFYITAGGQPAAYGNGATIATGSTALSATTWHHVALVKSAGTITLYLDGVGDGSGASSYTIACPAAPVIGRKLGSTANDFAGHIDDLRISKGAARYVASFTPPTAPFPEALQNAMIFDHLTPV